MNKKYFYYITTPFIIQVVRCERRKEIFMASFVIHHISGEAFLNELEKEGVVLSDTEKKQFLLGNLIVDSSRI